MKKMTTIPFFLSCSKNMFLKVLGPRLQIEIFDIPDYFFSNARILTPGVALDSILGDSVNCIVRITLSVIRD